MPALAGLPSRPPERLLAYVLRFTRLNRPSALRHASPARLSALAQGLRALSHEPDFGFQHSFAQAVRCHWSNLAPQVRTAWGPGQLWGAVRSMGRDQGLVGRYGHAWPWGM